MALQDQELAVGFGQGLDKKTDPKAVIPGKFLMLENAVFSEAHQISKRYGYDSLTLATYSPYTGATGTLTAPKMVDEFNSELVCQDSGRFFAYSPTLGSWVDKGPYESIASTQLHISSASSLDPQGSQSSAVLGHYFLVSWQAQYNPTSTQSAFAAVIDSVTNAKILPDFLLDSTSAQVPRSVALGSTSLAVLYVDSSHHLVCRILSTASNSLSFGAPVTIATDIATVPHSRNEFPASTYQFDVANTSSGAVVAYYNGSTITVKTLDTSAAVTHTDTTFTGIMIPSITVGSDGRIWVYGVFTSGTTTAVVHYVYIVYSAALSVVNATTAIGTINGSTGTGTANPLAVVAVADSTTQQTVIFNATDTNVQQDPFAPIVTKIVTTAGVVSSGTFTQAYLKIISKPFYMGTFRYLLTIRTVTPTAPVVYLFNIDSISFIGVSSTGAAVAKSLWGETAFTNSAGFTPPMSFLSATKVAYPFGLISETIIDGGIGGGSADTTAVVYSTTAMIFDWGNVDAYQALQFNSELALNGGVPALYDGNFCSELGFLESPVINDASGTGSVGAIPDGTRLYAAIYQWTDNQGNIVESAPSNLQRATNASGTSPTTYQVDVYCPLITLKDPSLAGVVTVALYRTTNGGGTFTQVGHRSVTITPGAANLVTFTDNLTDALIAGTVPLYINGGVLSNDPPPPFMVFNSHNNRIWAVDSTHDTTAWYTKTAQSTVGASFSGDLTVTVDSKGGAIAALAELDDKEVLFKAENRIAILYGDGANDTGAGSTLSNPQFIATDVGCSASKSVLNQPNGILFKSPKGWYLLDRSTQTHYIGYPVESYNIQDVTSARRLKDKTLCVFLTSSGATLAYDYFFNQWSTFTNHTGVASTIFQDKYTYVRTDGSVYQQNTTNYLDGATTYLLRAQTSWLNLGKIQNLQRVRQVFALGDHLSPVSGHGLQISAAYDFISTFSTPVVYTFSGTGTDPFQYREHLARQKCDTVSLLIEEVSAAPGTSGEYIDLTDLGFEAGMKKGPNKLSAAKSVG